MFGALGSISDQNFTCTCRMCRVQKNVRFDSHLNGTLKFSHVCMWKPCVCNVSCLLYECALFRKLVLLWLFCGVSRLLSVVRRKYFYMCTQNEQKIEFCKRRIFIFIFRQEIYPLVFPMFVQGSLRLQCFPPTRYAIRKVGWILCLNN